MNLEVKIRAAEGGAVRARLWELGRFEDVELLTNHYFHTHSGATLKIEEAEGRAPLLMAFVPQEESGGFAFLSAPLADARGVREVMEKALGLKVTLHKRREVFRFGDLEAALDQVDGLGDFVEFQIDIPDPEVERTLERIRMLAEELGLQWTDRVTVGYDRLPFV